MADYRVTFVVKQPSFAGSGEQQYELHFGQDGEVAWQVVEALKVNDQFRDVELQQRGRWEKTTSV